MEAAAAPGPPSPAGCAPSPGSTNTPWRKTCLSIPRPNHVRRPRVDYESHAVGPLAPRTARAIDLAVGERSEGPVFLSADGRNLDRHGAARIVRRAACRAGITKPVGPH